MPQIFAVVVKFVVASLVRIGVSQGIAALIGSFVVRLAVSAVIGAVVRALSPKPPAGAIDQGQELRTKIDPAYPREVAIGTFATGGSLVYENVSGAKNEYLWRVVALSDCEIEEITQVRGNGEALTFSGDIHTGLRACTSHFQSSAGADMLSVRIYKGTSGQTVDPDLDAAFSEIDSNFRLRGVAYALVKMTYDADAWGGGAELIFVGKGAKCLDPRTDTTVWTENAALILGQFMRGFENNGFRILGLGADASDLPDADLEDAADICDENVALAAGGTEDRYRAGGMISARESAREVITNLTAAMSGRHIDRGGEIVLLPGAARTSVLDTIVNGDLLADVPVQWAGRRTADERFNAITSTFVNPADGYQEAALPIRKNAAAITADGERLETNRAYRYVQSKTQGQRLDEIELRSNRQEGALSVGLPLWALELEPGDWQTFDLPHWGGGEKTFEIVSIGLAIVGGDQPQARVIVQAQEIASSVFDWTTGDEITQAGAAVTQPAPLPSRFDADGRLNGAFGSGNPVMTGATAYRTPANPLSSSDVGSTATVSVASHTVKTSDANGASKTASYNSGSVTGLGFSTAYYIWAYDPTFAGGAVTYVAATASDTYLTDNRYIYIGYVTTVADGGGGGGSPPTPPEYCVAADSWIDRDRLARVLQAGDLIEALTADGEGVERVAVDDCYVARVPSVRLFTQSGVRLTCSETTPITQRSGAVIRADRALGGEAAVIDAAGFRWERIVQVERVGLIEVARVHCGGRTYAAGDEPQRRMFTHNPYKP